MPADPVARITKLYFDLLAAWNARDAAAMAALYAPGGSQVGFDGSTADGAGEIEAHIAPIFAAHQTPRYVGKIREVRLIGDDAALLRAVAGLVPRGQSDLNPALNAIQTLVASRDADGSWRIEMFHNTPAAFHGRRDEAARLTAELRALIKPD